MAHIGPSCCCDPCDPPEVTCKRFSSPSEFRYTIADANIARIEETCRDTLGNITVTTTPITLTSGGATGSHPALSNCDYCVVATNACGTTRCCDTCSEPRCFIDSVSIQTDGSIVVAWRYQSGALLFDPGDEIVVATLNGVDILGDPNTDSGTLVIAKASIPSVITMVVTNDCGRTSTCTFDTPCCWNKSQLRISFPSVSDILRTCSQTYGPPFGSGNNLIAYDATIEWTGLSSLTGTYVFGVTGSNCEPPSGEYYVGDLNARWYWSETVTGARFPSGNATETATFELRIDGIRLLVRAGGLFLRLPATGTATQTGREVNFGSPVDPSFANTVSLRNNIDYPWMSVTGTCPQRYGVGNFAVTGINSSFSFLGWITGIIGSESFFQNPDVGVIGATSATNPPWCPGIRDDHLISYEVEYLV